MNTKNLFWPKLIYCFAFGLCYLSLSSFANESKKILVVEHRLEIKEIIVKDLEKLNYHVASTDIKNATLNWIVFQPDLVLLDMGVPFTDLYLIKELFLEILKIDPSNKAKVILTSSGSIGLLPFPSRQLIDGELSQLFQSDEHTYNTRKEFKIINNQKEEVLITESITQAQYIEQLINNNLPPKRISYLPKLEIKPTKELFNLIKSIKILKQTLESNQTTNLLIETISKQLEQFRMLERPLAPSTTDYLPKINKCKKLFQRNK